MRNREKIVIAGAIIGIWVVLLLFLPKQVYVQSPAMVPGLLFGMVAFGLWVATELMYKISPGLSAFGVRTTVLQAEPVSWRWLVDPKDKKHYKFGVYPHRGCRMLGMSGGGSNGYSVARMDLVKDIPGDIANVWVYGVPDIYKMDAPADGEIKDARCLPRDILDMVRQAPNYNYKSPILVYWDPPTLDMDPRTNMELLENLKYKNLWEESNKVVFELENNNDSLLKRNSKYAKTHEKNQDVYGNGRNSSRREQDEDTEN